MHVQRCVDAKAVGLREVDSIESGMKRSRPRSEHRISGYDMKDDVSVPFKDDVSRALLHDFLSHRCNELNEGDWKMGGNIICVAQMYMWIATVVLYIA